ncbi:MAG: molecular chaperone HtpG, partial [Clostridia bacterium]|nr:molecular chaperone HtpG [Clostridia bacterium]
PNNGQNVKAEKILEISLEHKILEKLNQLFETDKEKLKKYSVVLYEQARLLEGLSIDNVTEFVGAMSEIM